MENATLKEIRQFAYGQLTSSAEEWTWSIFKVEDNLQKFVRGGLFLRRGREAANFSHVLSRVFYRYEAARSISDRHDEKQWKRKRPMCVFAGIRY